jgi:hypothetical protein
MKANAASNPLHLDIMVVLPLLMIAAGSLGSVRLKVTRFLVLTKTAERVSNWPDPEGRPPARRVRLLR